MCRIDDTDGEPEFVIKIVEEGLKDIVLRDKSAKGELQRPISLYFIRSILNSSDVFDVICLQGVIAEI